MKSKINEAAGLLTIISIFGIGGCGQSTTSGILSEATPTSVAANETEVSNVSVKQPETAGSQLPSNDDHNPTEAKDGMPPPPTAPLSSRARKLNQLLNEGKLSAANTLVNTYLQQFPDDGGVQAMHARLLLLDSEYVFDFAPAESRILYILEACRNAVEFDPKLKPLVADMLLRQAIVDLRKAAASRSPVVFADLQIAAQEQIAALEYPDSLSQTENPLDSIGPDLYHGMELAAVGFLAMGMKMHYGHLYIAGGLEQGAILARELDPESSKKWARPLHQLGPKFAEQNWYASAMYMESLATYLEGIVDREQRVLASLQIVASRSEQIEASPQIKARANFALDQFVAAGWLEDVKKIVQQPSPEIKRLNEALQD